MRACRVRVGWCAPSISEPIIAQGVDGFARPPGSNLPPPRRFYTTHAPACRPGPLSYLSYVFMKGQQFWWEAYLFPALGGDSCWRSSWISYQWELGIDLEHQYLDHEQLAQELLLWVLCFGHHRIVGAGGYAN